MYVLAHLGLLVLGLAGFAAWPNLRRTRPEANSTVVNGITCSFGQERVSRSNDVRVTVSIPCDERFEFTIRREKDLDGIAKMLHLVHEFQTQDDRFDSAVYIGCDERGIDDWLSRDARARSTFLDLLALDSQEDTEVHALTASRGVLTLSALTSPAMFESAPDDIGLQVAQATLPGMKAVLGELDAFAARDPDAGAFYDRYAVAVRTLSSLAGGLIVIPIALIVLLNSQSRTLTLASNPFTDKGNLLLALGVVGILLCVAIPLLLGSARLHTVLLSLLLSGAFGALVAGPAFIRDVNEGWDRSPPEQYSAQVMNRYTSHSRHSTYYHLWLSDWHDHEDHLDVYVDGDTYRAITVGDTVNVVERRGFLGRRWVSGLSRDW